MAEHDLRHAKESQKALDQLIAKFAHGGTSQIAEVYAWRGERDKAFERLDRAYAQQDPGIANLKVEPSLANLRDDPRYVAMLKKLNLPVAK